MAAHAPAAGKPARPCLVFVAFRPQRERTQALRPPRLTQTVPSHSLAMVPHVTRFISTKKPKPASVEGWELRQVSTR